MSGEMGLEAVAQRGLYGVAGARDKETFSLGATGVRGSTSTTLGGGHVLVNEKPANDYEKASAEERNTREITYNLWVRLVLTTEGLRFRDRWEAGHGRAVLGFSGRGAADGVREPEELV